MEALHDDLGRSSRVESAVLAAPQPPRNLPQPPAAARARLWAALHSGRSVRAAPVPLPRRCCAATALLLPVPLLPVPLLPVPLLPAPLPPASLPLANGAARVHHQCRRGGVSGCATRRNVPPR